MGEPGYGVRRDEVVDLLLSGLKNFATVGLILFLIVLGLRATAPDEVRIRRSQNPGWLTGFVVDEEASREVQRLAAEKLAAVLEARPRALDRAEARLEAARDAAPEGPRRDALRQDMSLVLHGALMERERELRDRALAILGAAPDNLPEAASFAPLQGPQTVDAVTDVAERDGAIHFAFDIEERAVYSNFAASTFFGMTRAEMDARAASARTLGFVRRRNAIVGSVSGICSGDALREDADVYVIDLVEGRVTGAGTVIGRSPPAGPFQTLGAPICDVSGGPAERERLVVLARQ